tara:strand:+ start:57 stop:275 length:219 start_codon:yes stop_codon:yes gene_type:complete
MDTEAKALIGSYRHHISLDYSSADNRTHNESQFRKEFTRLCAIPVGEFSYAVWEELNELMNPEQYEYPDLDD